MFQCRGQLLLLNPLRHRCFCAEVFIAGEPLEAQMLIVLRYFYLVFSSEMENRTLSQMCSRLLCY